GAEEVAAILPGRTVRAEAQVGLVDERSRLQRVTGALLPQPRFGQPPQLVVNALVQPVERRAVAGSGRIEQRSDVPLGHGSSFFGPGRADSTHAVGERRQPPLGDSPMNTQASLRIARSLLLSAAVTLALAACGGGGGHSTAGGPPTGSDPG